MLTTYDPTEEEETYFNYYLSQNGNGIAVHRGRDQRGDGIGSFFSGLVRNAMPLLKSAGKSVGKRLLNTGMNMAGDLLAGENFGESAAKRFKGAAGRLVQDAQSALINGNSMKMGSTRGNPFTSTSIKPTRRKIRRKKQSGKGVDVFG